MGRFLSAVVVGLLSTGLAFADDTRIATWNLGAAWDGAVEARASQFEAAAAAVAADVYVVQEIMSLTTAEAIADRLGIDDPFIAVSDFAATSEQEDDDAKANVFFHLEVGVISTVPIVSAQELEFDRDDATGPLVNKTSISTRPGRLFVPPLVFDRLSSQTKNALAFGRGVLKVELEGDLVIYVVHSKSDFNGFCANVQSTVQLLTEVERKSDEEAGLDAADVDTLNGALEVLARIQTAEEATSFSKEWVRNAEKREAVFSALIEKVKADVAAGKTVMVMGDYNIALNDPRSGKDLANDCNPTRMCFSPVADALCNGQDGLDESHYILAGGVDPAVAMKPLTADLTETLTGTFSSAIDHIYVAGLRAENFSMAETFKDSDGKGFGSDHLPVLVTLTD
ncbi:hypothetical protein [Mesorhizobium sp.]|uniref:hypothetical protein n=1 Tax=Mesorhizobium sp. TaxID=1871066 RepID=UPI000FE5771D|nr:hypothetical protein [Mesorhizobium sp.]RWK34899.1 MAG: hypothetical protein EOR46_28275 [Mesorhizobium sp.]